MNTLRSFIIPVKGLKIGIHHFDFNLDESFFKAVNPESNVEGQFTTSMDFDRRHGMYVLDLEIKGVLKSPCDRCLESIDIPVEETYQLIIKLGEGEDDSDVIFIEHEADEFDVSSYIYEYTLLSFPMMKLVDCDSMENPPCNFDMLDKLYQEDESEDEEREEKSVWNELNKLNLKK